MAYNKTKLIETAQKYLQQGKIPQAIAEYQQILKQEPRDQVMLMTVGDLLVRQGETFLALEYFERLANLFINDGFTTKAIAIYKKIAKLAPEETRPLERLAELYVQQGVLSEARPLYLQLAEAHLKGGRQQQGAALLRRLLEAEPDNLRVQIRMAELCVAMGQHAEAAEAYRGAAQRLIERGDHTEALRLVGRALEIEPAHAPTLLLKARTLISSGKRGEGVALLESVVGIEAGGPESELLIAEYLASGTFEPAVTLSEKIFAHDHKNHHAAHIVVNALLEGNSFEPALKLLGLIRGAMTESDHEALEHSLDRAAEKMPDRYEPLEWLIELFGRNNDSFRLPDILARLSQTAERGGDFERARLAYEQLLDRNPEDEATRRRYVQLRARLGLEPMAQTTAFVKLDPDRPEAAPEPPPIEPPLDDETQRFVAQALTDVDLFSSYGLILKAIELLEEVRVRAPSHAPILERLLDLQLGAGEERRTADLAAELEKLWLSRGDRGRAERFTELRRRFDRAAGPSTETTVADAALAGDPPDFSVSVPEVEAEAVSEAVPEVPLHPEFSVTPVPQEFAEQTNEGSSADGEGEEIGVHEVDLSAEWAALSEEIEVGTTSEPIEPSESSLAIEKETPAIHAEHVAPLPVELEPTAAANGSAPKAAAPVEYEFELESADAADETLSSEQLLAELASGFDDIAALLVGEPAPRSCATQDTTSVAAAADPVPAQPVAALPTPIAEVTAAPDAAPPISVATSQPKSTAAAPPLAPTEMGALHQVFEEFRAELGEIDTAEEDIETHYNLGVAYREMGLLEEAISEFQKVAKASDRDQAFRYALQCCTLLGLSFMEKGQPSIAAMWYQRALRIPDLDSETQLALHYDLGVAQDLAGDTVAAQKSFAEVYGTNIDYRDVAERLAALDKAR